MELRILLRRPWRLAICALLSAALLTISLFFSLQAYIGAKSIDYVKKQYACVGTLVPSNTLGLKAGQIGTVEISDEAVELLQNSKYVSDIDIRSCVSAKIDGYTNILWGDFACDASSLIIFDGVVDNFFSDGLHTDGGLQLDAFLTDIRPYVCHPDRLEGMKKVKGNLWYPIITDIDGMYSDKWNPYQLENGKRYLFVAELRYEGSTGKPSVAPAIRVMPKYLESFPYLIDTMLPYLITPLPLNATENDVLAAMEDLGLDKYIDGMEETSQLYTVRYTKDMRLLLPLQEDNMFITEGRELTYADADKKVCVISAELANRYGWSVGDKIPLSFSKGNYLSAFCYRQGIPAFGELPKLIYGEPEEYEIVGLFAYMRYLVAPEVPMASDPYLFSYNDIFLPEAADAAIDIANAQPYSLSFEVMGEDYDAFMASTAKELNKIGYTARLSDEDWKNVESKYKGIEARQKTTVTVFSVTIAACCVLSALLLTVLYRREYALRNLLGAPAGKTWLAYFVPFAVSTLVGTALAVAAVMRLYKTVLSESFNEILPPELIPADSKICLLLLGVSLAVALMRLALQLVICLYQKKSEVRALLY